jgi:hypothetical protein
MVELYYQAHSNQPSTREGIIMLSNTVLGDLRRKRKKKSATDVSVVREEER